MRRIFLLVTVLIVSISLISCSSNQNSGKVASAAGDPISVQGDNTRYSLRSVDFIDENTGWMVGDNFNKQQATQVLRTQDGGAHWEQVKLQDLTLLRLKFVSKTTGWAIAQVGSKNTPGTQTGKMKIMYTQDGGSNWDVRWEGEAITSSDYNFWIQDTSNGYALIGNTLLSTRDGGKQWSPVSFGIDEFVPQHASFADADTGWVIGKTQMKNEIIVLGTTDGGKLWQQQFRKVCTDAPAASIDIAFANATTGWFLTSSTSTMMGDLYYTSNSGRDWNKINQIRSARPTPAQLRFITPEVGCIPLASGAGPISGGFMFTRDGGKSFDTMDANGGITSALEVDFTSRQQGWAIGTDANYGDYLVHTTDGGKTWTQVYPRIRPTEDMAFADNQNGFGLGQLSDPGALLYTPDGGDTWESPYSFSKDFRPSMLTFTGRNNGWVLAASKSTGNMAILKSSDSGKTWAPLAGAVPVTETSLTVCFRFFDPDNGLLISRKPDSTNFYRTQDGGKTWQVSEEKSSKYINQFSFVSAKQGWQVNLSGNGHTVDLCRTEDGAAWQPLGQIGTDTRSYGITFISKDKGWMLVEEPPFQSGSSKKLLVTADGGKTWSSSLFPSGFELEMLKSQIPMQFTDDLHGWVLSSKGMLSTVDGGKTWTWK